MEEKKDREAVEAGGSTGIGVVETRIQRLMEMQRDYRETVAKTTARERIAKLRRLLDLIEKRKQDIRDAVHADFRKPVAEIDLSEIFVVTSEIKHAIRHLRKWMKPLWVPRTLTMLTTRSWIRYEPRGHALIISPWNFPFNLTMGPLVSALAAGNVVMVKPSEYSHRTSELMADMTRTIFDEREVAFVPGDARVAQALLKQRFDHIFFTGSPKVGKIVMKAAAEHLATVTLELGGKSPAVVTASADLANSAEKLVWGKFVNKGQTCIAPDYVLVDERVAGPFVDHLKKKISEFYGATEDQRQETADLARVIDDRHYNRVKQLLMNALELGATAETGGLYDDGDRYIAPTVLTGVKESADVMTEEIFGPLLPVLRYRDLGDAIRSIRSREKPLALYVFSKDGSETRRIISETTSGTACINHNLIQYLHLNVPFGGVNNSGSGNSHGFYGFRAFSHERAVVKSASWSPLKLMYPPYTKKVRRWVDLLLKYF